MIFRIACLLLFVTLFKVGATQVGVYCSQSPAPGKCYYETSIAYQTRYRRQVRCFTPCETTTNTTTNTTTSTCFLNETCPTCNYYDSLTTGELISNITRMECSEFTQCVNATMTCVDFLSQFTMPPPTPPPPSSSSPTPETLPQPPAQTTSWSSGSTITLSIMLVVDLMLIIIFVARIGRRRE